MNPSLSRPIMSRMRVSASALAAAVALACAGSPPPADPPPDWTGPLRQAASELADHLRALSVAEASQGVVRLAFSGEVDLDLYVTDPQLETVYFANTPSRSGGRLERDRRCDDEGRGPVRVETVRFEAPPSGRYRVGVDYSHRCDGADEVAPYAISIEVGGQRSLHAGLARRLEFTTVATEFDVK